MVEKGDSDAPLLRLTRAHRRERTIVRRGPVATFVQSVPLWALEHRSPGAPERKPGGAERRTDGAATRSGDVYTMKSRRAVTRGAHSGSIHPCPWGRRTDRRSVRKTSSGTAAALVQRWPSYAPRLASSHVVLCQVLDWRTLPPATGLGGLHQS